MNWGAWDRGLMRAIPPGSLRDKIRIAFIYATIVFFCVALEIGFIALVGGTP